MVPPPLPPSAPEVEVPPWLDSTFAVGVGLVGVLLLLFGQFATGFAFGNLGMPAAAQPIHLFVASITCELCVRIVVLKLSQALSS